jgi:GTP-binding protein Era
MRDEMTAETADFRAGICAIVGLPNVGKSTLLNRLVGQRLSIVTEKAQTTRQRLLGIYSDDEHQVVFVDTPGILKPRYALHEAHRASLDSDVLVYVADAGWPPSLEHAENFGARGACGNILCLNKVDRVTEAEARAIRLRLAASGAWQAIVPTVATRDEGMPALKQAIRALLPVGAPLYPLEDIATAPVRFFAAELIRETCFEVLEKEVPYAIAVLIDEFRESDDPVYISSEIHVERESQKGIVIGRGGRMVREIGTKSRLKLEDLLQRPVYLDLRVKVSPNWRRRPGRLKVFGYDLPESR